ncbi:MAG: hypothetical protein AAF459_01505, partial [Pseudomonadota bacterium]
MTTPVAPETLPESLFSPQHEGQVSAPLSPEMHGMIDPAGQMGAAEQVPVVEGMPGAAPELPVGEQAAGGQDVSLEQALNNMAAAEAETAVGVAAVPQNEYEAPAEPGQEPLLLTPELTAGDAGPAADPMAQMIDPAQQQMVDPAMQAAPEMPGADPMAQMFDPAQQQMLDPAMQAAPEMPGADPMAQMIDPAQQQMLDPAMQAAPEMPGADPMAQMIDPAQ